MAINNTYTDIHSPFHHSINGTESCINILIGEGNKTYYTHYNLLLSQSLVSQANLKPRCERIGGVSTPLYVETHSFNYPSYLIERF